MNENLIIMGIGGTGAKIVEAVVHLASSGNAPLNIYPVLIDQDIYNGNVHRCRRVINLYDTINKELLAIDKKWLFKSKLVKVNENLLPLVPESIDRNFASAIKHADMEEKEQKIINSLYTEKQLNEILKDGYKKRAHMGAPLMEKLLINERKKDDTEMGLKMIVSDTSNYDNVQVFVVGSIFGGTGASGITNVGKFFREQMPHAIINSIMLTPYFIVSDQCDENDKDKGLVRSDADMQLVKVALEMYNDDIKSAFDHVFLIGSQKVSISGEIVTDKSHSGGKEQENPSHIFELLSAIITNDLLNDKPESIKYHSYVVDSENKTIPPFKFYDIPEIIINGEKNIDKEKIYLLRSFSYLLSSTQDAKESWKKRQPWIPTERQKLSFIYDWANRHNQFWTEISGEMVKGRAWKKFYYDDKIKHERFKLSSKLTLYLNKNQSESVSDTLKSLNKLLYF